MLHTFGKDMKFNPHLHILALNGHFGNDGVFHRGSLKFLSSFSREWRSIALGSLGVFCFDKYRYGFYVWSKRLFNRKHISRYIGRYLRHPCIANTRILFCENGRTAFFYPDQKGKRIIVKTNTDAFIAGLIQHIPPKNFKMVRYYGAYSRRLRKRFSPQRQPQLQYPSMGSFS